MEIPLLSELVIILGLSVLVILLFNRLKLPTILGFLMTGLIAGPYGFNLISNYHEVEVLAEIGVILLLFIIGIEFSLKKLIAIKDAVLIGGSIQVFGTTLVTFIFGHFLQMDWNKALFLGFLISLSSTAIVLKLVQGKGEVNSPHGKTILAILIFQDIIVVPMMIFTPLLAGQSDNVWLSLGILALKAIFMLVFVIVSARFLVPTLLYLVAKTKSKELFILAVVVICFAVAWLSSAMGLSLALGAFLAGLIISESEYSHQATSNILPFHEIFTSFFFVSIGMLLDLGFLAAHILPILGLVILVFLGKSTIAALAATALKYPFRTVLVVGLSLFQVGEFSFILSKTGMDYNLLDQEVYQYFLSVSLLSMALTPFIINYSNTLAIKLTNLDLAKRLGERNPFYSQVSKELITLKDDLEDHAVIIGYGVNGKNVAKAAKEAGISYVILELNADTVRNERQKGEFIIYGDAMEEEVLRHVRVQKARMVIVAISDPFATKKIVVNIRDLSPKVHVIVRTRFVTEVEELMKLGADEVIPEEFETSVEIFTRMLERYLVPRNQIEQFVEQIRSGNYEMLRGLNSGRGPIPTLDFPNMEFASVQLECDDAKVIGKTLAESDFRARHGVTLLGIKREKEILENIGPDTVVEHGDILFIFGRKEKINTFCQKVT